MRVNPLVAIVALVTIVAALVYGLILAYSPKPQLLQGR